MSQECPLREKSTAGFQRAVGFAVGSDLCAPLHDRDHELNRGEAVSGKGEAVSESQTLALRLCGCAMDRQHRRNSWHGLFFRAAFPPNIICRQFFGNEVQWLPSTLSQQSIIWNLANLDLFVSTLIDTHCKVDLNVLRKNKMELV